MVSVYFRNSLAFLSLAAMISKSSSDSDPLLSVMTSTVLALGPVLGGSERVDELEPVAELFALPKVCLRKLDVGLKFDLTFEPIPVSELVALPKVCL